MVRVSGGSSGPACAVACIEVYMHEANLSIFGCVRYDGEVYYAICIMHVGHVKLGRSDGSLRMRTLIDDIDALLYHCLRSEQACRRKKPRGENV
jgi:hypothetical protein